MEPAGAARDKIGFGPWRYSSWVVSYSWASATSAWSTPRSPMRTKASTCTWPATSTTRASPSPAGISSIGPGLPCGRSPLSPEHGAAGSPGPACPRHGRPSPPDRSPTHLPPRRPQPRLRRHRALAHRRTLGRGGMRPVHGAILLPDRIRDLDRYRNPHDPGGLRFLGGLGVPPAHTSPDGRRGGRSPGGPGSHTSAPTVSSSPWLSPSACFSGAGNTRGHGWRAWQRPWP